MSGVSSSTNTVESPGPPRVTLKQNQRKKTICSFFAKGETCRFGRNCRFLHESPHFHLSSRNIQVNDNGAVSEQAAAETGSTKYIPPHRLRYNHEAVTDQAHHQDPLPVNQNTFGQICKFFARNGYCNFGENCRYLHQTGGDLYLDPEQCSHGNGYRGRGRGGRRGRQEVSGNRPAPHLSTGNKEGGRLSVPSEHTAHKGNKKASAASGKRPKPTGKSKPRKPVCRFFKVGDCRHGNNCKFWHPSDLPELSDNEDNNEGVLDAQMKQLEVQKRSDGSGNSQAETDNKDMSSKPIIQPVTEFSLEDLTDEESAKHRIAEINSLMKRFPRSEQTSLPRWREEAYKFIFVPSDPDWPYDVKEVQMTILFPDSYPRDCMVLKLSKEQPLPNTLRRYLYNSLHDWLSKRYDRLIQKMRVELVFRPFLRWVDKNLEDLFTEGLKQYQRELMAKAAGIEIVTAGELKERYSRDEDSDDGDNEEEEEEEDEYSDDEDSYEDDEEEETSDEKPEFLNQPAGTAIDPVRKGTEVKLHNLQLKEGATTLMALKLKLIVQCGRCKYKDEVCVRQNQGVSLLCGQCSNSCVVAYRPAIVHQFSSVIGYLDVDGCSAFDLILSETDFMIGCEGCNKEMKTQGIAPGLARFMWCQHCHQKLKVIVETTRFLQLQPNVLAAEGLELLSGTKKNKMIKDPSIKEGLPLPDNGTCKHYKKSFRWLRFPCCGKTYPCDVCHDEKEDHPFLYANRMICGFCAKEQPYAADRPCKACDSSMTKKYSSHWEGGKGCRDKIKMSRGDEKKYANVNKTISRRSQTKPSTGKKTTKLRHI